MTPEFDDYPEPYEDDLEEHEKNELAKDRELEEEEFVCDNCGTAGGGACPECSDQCDCGDCDSCEARLMSERFADPGGISALYPESPSNPRNLPCPNCERENMLTPKDRAAGYQCDICARETEMGGY